MAANEVGGLDQVRRVDRVGSETQVRNGARAGLFRVIHEVALRIVLGFLADDLDRVLVRAHRAVGAETEEHRADDLVGLGDEGRINFKARMGHIVLDAEGEMVAWAVFLQFVQRGLDLCRCEFLGGQAVASADDFRHVRHREFALAERFGQRGDYILIQRFAVRAGLLRAIQYRDGMNRLRQRREEVLGGEWAVEMDIDQADFLALCVQMLNGFKRGLCARAHENDNALRIRRAEVIKQLVSPAGGLRELLHDLFHDVRAGVVEGITGFAGLEKDVGILRRAADDRMIRAQRARAVLEDSLLVDYGADLVIAEQLDLVDFVRGPEAVEKVHKRNAGFER